MKTSRRGRYVAEAGVLPVGVHRRLRGALLAAQASQTSEVLIPDLMRRQAVRQSVAIELRIGSRPWNRAHESMLGCGNPASFATWA